MPREPESNDDAPRPTTDPQGPPPTPFDHPLFLPVLLLGGTLWFGYDGYLNQDPEMLEHLSFNRFGVRVLAYATALLGMQGVAEWRRTAPPRFAAAAIHGAMALWLAFDAFVSSDPFYADYTLFNAQAAAVMATLGAWLAIRAARGPAAGGAFVLPALIAAAAALFGASAWRGDESRLLHGLTAATLVGVAIYSTPSAFRERRAARHDRAGGEGA